jgi:hypothetical protein
MTTEQAAAEVIRAAGFDRMAADVESGKHSAAATLDYLLRGRLANDQVRPGLEKARQLLGKRHYTREEIRAHVEGRQRIGR